MNFHVNEFNSVEWDRQWRVGDVQGISGYFWRPSQGSEHSSVASNVPCLSLSSTKQSYQLYIYFYDASAFLHGGPPSTLTPTWPPPQDACFTSQWLWNSPWPFCFSPLYRNSFSIFLPPTMFFWLFEIEILAMSKLVVGGAEWRLGRKWF